MKFIDENSLNRLNFKELLSRVDIFSAYGKNKLNNVQNFLVGEEEKLEEEFTTLQSYQSVVELLNSQYEDLASRMDPAILEAANMPMDIRSSNPTTFSDTPPVLPTHTNSSQVQVANATPAPKQEAKVEEIKPKKENSQAVASADSSKYAAATTGVVVGLLAGLFGFKKKKQSSRND